MGWESSLAAPVRSCQVSGFTTEPTSGAGGWWLPGTGSMTARMHELLGLLGKVVDHVRAAADRAGRAEARVAEMTRLLDALADENAALRAELERSESAIARTDPTIRRMREMLEDERRTGVALEARVAEAEARIARAADVLGTASRPGQDIPLLSGASLPTVLH